MGNVSSTHKISAHDEAILRMKNQRDNLHQYQRKIKVLTDRETQVAKDLLAQGNRKGALLALKKKKYQESLLAKTDSQLEQLEILTSDVEFALVQKDVLFGLQQGTQVLKAIQREMGGLSNVEKLMGENDDARAYQQEVSDMLGGKLSNQDEDEVEEELALLQEQAADIKLPDAPTAAFPEASHREATHSQKQANAKTKAEPLLA
ncbi:MAG: Vacuolar protein sorting-associated protein 20 [Vezdaea aestivalis]|nr:MAG: Vacuolar protein sorting-associated protein 20 [Vezdaea aestivalis]